MRVKVIGAGFSGLAISYHLIKRGVGVDLYEKENKIGGMIETIQDAWGQYEKAAGSFLNSAQLEKISKDINISLISLSPHGKQKYLFWEGQIRRFPNIHIRDIGNVLRFFCLLFFQTPRYMPFFLETVGEWGRRVLGIRLSRAFFTILQGVYGGSPEKLSASLVLRTLLNGKPENTEKMKLGRGSVYPENGMQNWNEAMYTWLQKNGARFFLGVFVHKDRFNESDPIVLTLPAYKIRESGWEDMFGAFCNVQYRGVVSVVCFRNRDKTEEKKISLRGFGCLFPSNEKFYSLGVILPDGQFCSSIDINEINEINDIKKTDRLQDRWMLGDGALDKTNEQIFLEIDKDFKKLFGFHPNYHHREVFRHSNGIPVYDTNLEKILTTSQRQVKNSYLFGNYTGALGLTKILRYAEELADKIQKELTL